MKMIDIVIPSNNEEEFIAMAYRLGYKELCFLYELDDYANKKKELEKIQKIKIYTGVLANSKNINKIRNKLGKAFVAVKSQDSNREIIEKSKADMIFSLEDSLKRDFIHQRASGLNHILCRSAKENKIIIGFSLSLILNSQNKFSVLGRMAQNIRLCKKFKVQTAIASFAQKPLDMRSAHDMISLFELLGLENPEFVKFD